MRTLGALALLVLVCTATACSTDPKGQPQARSTQSATASGCQAEGGTSESTWAERPSANRLTLLYGGTLDLAQGTAHRGGHDYDLVGQVRPRVSVTDPRGVALDARQRREIAVPGSIAPLPPTMPLRADVSNTRGGHPRTWAVYGVARVHRGTWRQGVCRGTFVSFGRVRTGVEPCERVRAARSEFAEAIRELCR